MLPTFECVPNLDKASPSLIGELLSTLPAALHKFVIPYVYRNSPELKKLRVVSSLGLDEF